MNLQIFSNVQQDCKDAEIFFTEENVQPYNSARFCLKFFNPCFSHNIIIPVIADYSVSYRELRQISKVKVRVHERSTEKCFCARMQRKTKSCVFVCQEQ